MELFSFELPNGFTYEGKLIRKGLFKALGTQDLNYLRNQQQVKKDYKATGWSPLDVIVRRNIVEWEGVENKTYPVDPKDHKKGTTCTNDELYTTKLHAADSLYLAIEQRIHGVSKNYTFSHKCSYCNGTPRSKIDLTQLSVREQPVDFRGQEEITLPVEHPEDGDMPVVITFRPLLASHLTELKKIDDEHPAEKATREMALRLIRVNDQPANLSVIEKLSYKEMLAFDFTMDKASGGVDWKVERKCPLCQAEIEFSMPIDPVDFLLPGKRSTEKIGLVVPASTQPSGTTEGSCLLGARGLSMKK